MEWAPIVYQLTNQLTKDELWKIKIGGNYQDSIDNHAMVDHLKLDVSGGGSSDYLFGTTKTYLRNESEGAHTQVHIFRISLTSDHKIDQSVNPVLAQLKPTDLGSDSFFTGISNQLENAGSEFHSLMYDPQN